MRKPIFKGRGGCLAGVSVYDRSKEYSSICEGTCEFTLGLWRAGLGVVSRIVYNSANLTKVGGRSQGAE